MANTFTRKLSRSIGTALTAVGSYTVGASTQTTVIGLTVANTSASSVNIDVTLNDGANDTYIVKDAPVPVGGALVPIGGNQKIVMVTGDSIKVNSSAASSVDAVLSVLEIT
jgi:phage tail sheath gpL-like|tara:strand:- start:388 stop:720 length:333 start_codon:yes stop_codon:yes gene_type:complete